MKNQIFRIIFISTCFLFVNCGNDDTEQSQIINENINKLSEDPLFLEYLKKESDATKRIVDLRIAYNLRENLRDLTDSEKGKLAESLGYQDFESMKKEIIAKQELALQLNKKYGLSQLQEGILNKIIIEIIKDPLYLFQFGVDANTKTNSSFKNQDYCFLSGLEAVFDDSTSAAIRCETASLWLEIIGAYIGNNLDDYINQYPLCLDAPSQEDSYYCILESDIGYYGMSFSTWNELACCISVKMGSLDCPTERAWCENYPCC